MLCRKVWLVGLLCVLSYGVAFGQEISPTLPSDAEPMPRSVVKKSMKQLIDDGYQIVSFSAGLGGYGYLLHHQNSWVICSLGLYGSPPALKTFSRCELLTP